MITKENIKDLSWVYKGKTIATFTLLFQEGAEVPSMRMMDGSNGYFISPPSLKVGREWRKVVILSGKARRELLDVLIEAQDKLVRKEGEKKKRPAPFPLLEMTERREKEKEYLEWKEKNLPF